MRAQVRFPNCDDVALPVSELEVRWDKPVDDPSKFLAAQINESPLFADARSQFTRSLIEQRGACSGMSALLSSVIDLEQHQYEVVKRVLQDPVQRYLLADEVGLGKTVEAGVLIRQYVLDNPEEHSVLVIAPSSLLVQWRRELRKRFLLGDLLDDSILVMSIDDDLNRLLEALQNSQLVVIDEAHHLSHDQKVYSTLREAIIAVPRVLLLSATPVLHNERGFLEMLHLLDPETFKLEDENSFRQRIENRQVLAESVAGLVPENLLQIEDYLDDLSGRFPDDALLREHLDRLRNIVMDFPEENDPEFVEALRSLKAHLTETYRLDRRILRNRRRDLPFLTPDRAGLTRVTYPSIEEAALVQAIASWRSAAAETVYSAETSDKATLFSKCFRELIEALFVDAGQVALVSQDRLATIPETKNDEWEVALLQDINSAAVRCASSAPRINALIDLVDRELQSGAKIVVFCSSKSVADYLAERLSSALPAIVGRHSPHENPEDDDVIQQWELFLSDPEHRVLICDSAAEEGLNLQGGEKIVIHYDLPLAPNSVEQRLGRTDRYGSGDAIRSYAFCCEEDPYVNAWLTYLERGLMVFNRSVASLQYVIEDEMQSLTRALFFEGVDAMASLTDRSQGKSGTAERELRRIDDQDALDALTLSDESEPFELLTDVDGDWRNIASGLDSWLVRILQAQTELWESSSNAPFGFGPFRLAFSYTDRGKSSLIPLKRIVTALIQVLDSRATGSNYKFLKTAWYSCRRAAALSSSGPQEEVRLVRWGDTLVDRIQELMSLDDRGRVAAMWRQSEDYRLKAGNSADVYLRCDFIVEADVLAHLEELDIGDDISLRKALLRRGDMVLPPFYKTIWLDEFLNVVTDSDTRAILEGPYQKQKGEGGYQDFNLNSDRWALVHQMNLPVVEAWREWVPEACTVAATKLREETDLDRVCELAVERCNALNQGRFAQLEARIRGSDVKTALEAERLLVREKAFAETLNSALKAPKVTLGTLCAVFVSPHSGLE